LPEKPKLEKSKIKLKYLVPNLFTAFSLISGMFALQYVFERKFVTASWLIAASMVFDGLDGKIARLLKASSRFGSQFDTLSDFFVFGIVPAFLVYKSAFFQLKILGMLIAVFYVFAGGYRLVRFSLKNTDLSSKHSFTGLPIPAAASLIASYYIIVNYFWNGLHSLNILLIIVIFSTILMVSKIEYLPIEKKAKMTKESKFFLILAFLSLILAIKYSYLIFSGWVLIYIFYGIVRYFVLLAKKR